MMKLEVNKSYLTPSGKLVTIRSKCWDREIGADGFIISTTRYIGNDNCYYTENGIPIPPLYTSSSLAISREPLIALYTLARSKEKPKLCVGKTYMSESGKAVRITQTLFLERWTKVHRFEVYLGHNDSLYTQHGQLIPRFDNQYGEDQADLILTSDNTVLPEDDKSLDVRMSNLENRMAVLEKAAVKVTFA